MGTLDDGRPSTALLTDHYELTMLDAALRSGVAQCRAVFEVFCRRLPPGRSYGVVAGIARVVDAIERFRFGDEELSFLWEHGVVRRRDTIDWLRTAAIDVHVDAYAEGELYVPNTPILTVEGPFGASVLLETVVLSILNHDSAVAAAAARIVDAAGGRPVIEMGSRRVHEEAGVTAARAAWIAGCASTSNIEAGRRYGVPTGGTAAHAFTLAHPSEREAFAVQVEVLGLDTTLLVDTYDVPDAIRTAVAVAAEAGGVPGAIRLDSGDLTEQAFAARRILDDLGAGETRIVASGDLDEYRIAEIVAAGAPVDVFGVGTRLAAGSGAPTAELVYKLVAATERPGWDAALFPVEKRSEGKATIGGRKAVWRRYGRDGSPVEDVVVLPGPNGASRPRGADGRGRVRPLQRRVIEQGCPLAPESAAEAVERARAHHLGVRDALTPAQRSLEATEPFVPVMMSR